MSAYDELYAFAQDWVSRQDKAKSDLEQVVTHFIRWCGIPGDRVLYLPWDATRQVFSGKSGGISSFSQGCRFDNATEEWSIALSISLATPGVTGRSHAKVGIVVKLKANESDYTLTFGSLKPKTVNLKSSGWGDGLFEAVIESLKASFKNPNAKSEIGFNVSYSE